MTKVRSPQWYLGMGGVGLVLAVLSAILSQDLLRRISAVAGMLVALPLIAKGFQGLDAAAGTSSTRESVIWRAPWLSFSSAGFYDDVGRRGRGAGILYLLALQAATWLVFMVPLYIGLHGFLEGEGQRLIGQVPPIAIKEGRVQVDAPQPYYIRFEEKTGPEAMVLDTTGEIASLENRPDLSLLLARDKLYIRESSGEVKTHDLSQTQSFELNQTILRSWIQRYTVPFLAVGYLVVALASFCYRLLQALLYAAIGLGFASMFGKELSYQASFRLSIAAITPVVLLDTLLGSMKVSSASGMLWWLLCLAATLGFLAFGVKSLGDE